VQIFAFATLAGRVKPVISVVLIGIVQKKMNQSHVNFLMSADVQMPQRRMIPQAFVIRPC
jgi:hypothetical protein